MPVPSSITDLSKNASDNSPAGTESAKGTIDDYLRAHGAFIRQLSDQVNGPTVTLPSAPTVNIGFAGTNNIAITGGNTIVAFDSVSEGTMRWVTFASALTLGHNPTTLILPGGANILTVAGDVALFKSLGGGSWKCMVYVRNSVLFPATGTLLSTAAAVTVAQGGTGAGNAEEARANLGVLAASQVVKINVGNTSQGTLLESNAPPRMDTINNAGLSNYVPLIISNAGGANSSAVMQFLRVGQFAAFFGIDTDNQWKVGGYSMGAAYRIWHEGNLNPAAFAQWTGGSFTGGISAPTVTETSDERKKKAWQGLPAGFVDELAKIRKAGLFTWKRGGAQGLGVGAQSLERILPAAVHTDEKGAKSVQYGAAAMVAAVELARVVVALEQRLAKLEAR